MDPRTEEVHLWREGDTWVAEDLEPGVASQGSSREEALAMLDEAAPLHEGDLGRPVTDGDLTDPDIDPETGPDERRESDASWFDSE